MLDITRRMLAPASAGRKQGPPGDPGALPFAQAGWEPWQVVRSWGVGVPEPFPLPTAEPASEPGRQSAPLQQEGAWSHGAQSYPCHRGAGDLRGAC